jgi:hypothetical protein
MLHGLSTLDVSVARQREPRGPAADVHPMTSETTPTERHPDVADVFAFCQLHCRNAGHKLIPSGLKLRVEP